MKQLGDITKINGAEIPIVDVITGGSPCQDLSVAGKRAGLDGERSGLFMEQIRIVKEMREHDRRVNHRSGFMVRPRYMVWENVPGALSSPGGENKGKDFQAVLTEIVRIADESAPDVPLPDKGRWSKSGCLYDSMGGWSVAWRVHDAQYWGVPQRRKRIALVADFGGLSAPEILFERKGLRRDPKESGKTGQGITEAAAGGTEEAGGQHQTAVIYGFNRERGVSVMDGKTPTLEAAAGTSGNNKPMVLSFQKRAGKPGGGKGILIQEDHVGALSTFNNQSVVYGISAYNSNAMKSPNPKSGIYEANASRTLDLNGGNPACNQGGMCVYTIGHDERSAGLTDDGKTDPLTQSDYKDPIKIALRAQEHGHQPVILYGESSFASYTDKHIATLKAQGGHNGGGSENLAILGDSVVRRLTPLECERLQGFPDGWTDIGEWTDSKGKKHKDADSPRYKALGNSIAVPFWFYLLRRIAAQYERPATLGSLFDGIGGFPYCWEKCNGKGTAIWASEIEEFPMAVTKMRFGED